MCWLSISKSLSYVTNHVVHVKIDLTSNYWLCYGQFILKNTFSLTVYTLTSLATLSTKDFCPSYCVSGPSSLHYLFLLLLFITQVCVTSNSFRFWKSPFPVTFDSFYCCQSVARLTRVKSPSTCVRAKGLLLNIVSVCLWEIQDTAAVFEHCLGVENNKYSPLWEKKVWARDIWW